MTRSSFRSLQNRKNFKAENISGCIQSAASVVSSWRQKNCFAWYKTKWMQNSFLWRCI